MNLNNKRKSTWKSIKTPKGKVDLEDDIDQLMNDWDTELVFEKEDSEKNDVSDGQSNILIPEVNIHVKHPEESKEESQKDRVDVPKAKENPKGQSKEQGKRMGKEEGKEKEKTKLVE